ncbi:MAG TPA: GGDEF domain-containing protein [Dehalococcoidia bacterium]|nr:GGDEF domain-containing protein [Dehalococcoidia bacterium]
MSLAVARKKRTSLYLSIAGLLVMVAAVSAISARDPDGAGFRVGMVMMTVGAALWLPWRALLPAALAIWFGPNYIRASMDDAALFSTNMMLELPGLLGVAAFAGLSRLNLRRLEDEDMLLGATSDEFGGIDAATGVYDERLLRPALDAELARARRFNHQFALVLVGVDELRQRFDYRDQEAWNQGLAATANLLRSTRTHIDRAYRFGNANFALILPESGEREVTGLIRRLRRVARQASPAEGEPGGPLPTHFGATFFPQAATTTDDLLRRAEIALRLADKNSSRIQIDGAEAPNLPAVETLRREDASAAIDADANAPAVVAEAVPSARALIAAAAAEPVVEEDEPAPEMETGMGPEQADGPMPIPLRPYFTVSDAPAAQDEEVGEPAEEEFALPEPIPFSAFVDTQPTLEETPAGVEEMDAEPVLEPPVQITAFAKQPAELQDESMDDLMKHLDETLAMIRSLRTGTGP